jgi:hypothetical protein
VVLVQQTRIGADFIKILATGAVFSRARARRRRYQGGDSRRRSDD